MSSPKPKAHTNLGKKVNPIHSAARHRNSPSQGMKFFASQMAEVEEKMNKSLEIAENWKHLTKMAQLKLEASLKKERKWVLKVRHSKLSGKSFHKMISREKLNRLRIKDKKYVEAGNFCDPSDKMRRENLLKKAHFQGKQEVIRNMKEYLNLRKEWASMEIAYEKWLIQMAELKRPDFMKNILLYRGRGAAGPKTETENRLTETFETENQRLTKGHETENDISKIKPFQPQKPGLIVDTTKLSHADQKTQIKNQLTETVETETKNQLTETTENQQLHDEFETENNISKIHPFQPKKQG